MQCRHFLEGQSHLLCSQIPTQNLSLNLCVRKSWVPSVLISEIFGRGVHDQSESAMEVRLKKQCPFRGSKCTKSSKSNPLGICSFGDSDGATSVCPVRFTEGNRIFIDAARLAFGADSEVAVFPEIKILSVPMRHGKVKKIGKVDYIIACVDGSKVIDFAALEVQATYFSGGEIRTAFNHYLVHGKLNEEISSRRPDFRSSAQKRLMPQLQLKVPVFRRWGKKFFVVVDAQFFSRLPTMKQASLSNSEIVWLSYPIKLHGENYNLDEPQVFGSHWDDVMTALREGNAPEKDEILRELQIKLGARNGPRRFSI